MKIELDRNKRIILLKWLKKGYIETMDLPEAYKGGSIFLELMQSLPDLPDNKEQRKN